MVIVLLIFITDWVDSSGVSFYYTSKLRKYDAGTMELGLEYSDKMAIPPGQDAFRLDSYCVPECTRVVSITDQTKCNKTITNGHMSTRTDLYRV